jgi:hypothetical protein
VAVVRIDFLYREGCPSHPEAEELRREAFEAVLSGEGAELADTPAVVRGVKWKA